MLFTVACVGSIVHACLAIYCNVGILRQRRQRDAYDSEEITRRRAEHAAYMYTIGLDKERLLLITAKLKRDE